MSGRRSELARKRRRKERRHVKQGVQEIKRAERDHGETTAEPKFDRRTTMPCPDCNLENRLRSTDLRPQPIGMIPLQPSRLSKWRPKATAGCETCGGSGTVALAEYDQVDPYDMSRSESRENAEGIRIRSGGKDTPPT